MSEVSENKSKNRRKKNKGSDVMCWNCFTSEDGGNDVIEESIEPIPLPKVREEHREKLKVYSFLASELSKPKAVSLKQKISEPYKVGKKIDAEILKQQSSLPNSNNIKKELNSEESEESNSFNHSNGSGQNKLLENAISKCVTSYIDDDDLQDNNKSDTISNLEEVSGKIQDHQNSTCVPQVETMTQNVINVKSPTDSLKKISKIKTNELNENAEINLEMNQDNLTQNSSSYTSSRQQISDQNQEECNSSGKITDDKRNTFEGPTPKTVFKLKELEKFTPLLTSKVTERAFVRNTSDELGTYKEIPSSKTSLSQRKTVLPTLEERFNKLSLYEPCKDTICSNKPAEIGKMPCESPKITPIKFRKINSDSKIPVLKQSSPVLSNKNSIKNDGTVRSFNLNKEKFDLTKTLEEKHIQGEETRFKRDKNENTCDDKISLQQNIKNITDSDKIVHKVQILTSTPKEKCIIVNETPSEGNIVKCDLNLSESKDEIALNSDKIDNASSNGSESGYTGSLATVQEFVIDEHHAEIKDNENIERNDKNINKELTSSVYSLNTINKKPPTHSSSFSTGMNNVGKRPIKSLRWSTLSMAPRSVSFQDEVYISEAVSPGHATLPRRSNSPLPHDRDVDRDRFPINRSGLQVRSESMASVYSGAGEGLRGSVTVRGEVQFSLLYNYRLGALEVGVKRCRDLAPVDVKRNRSDPYVKVYLLPDKSKAGKRKTKVKKNTLNPVFEETLSFVQPLASLSARTLWLSAWHADMFGRNDFLGEVTLPLADVVFDDPAPMWYKLHERTEQFDEQQGSRGDLVVGLKFELVDAARGKGTLHVLVKEAKNLVATKPNGLADVFCKSYLLPERGRLAKQKTTVVRRSLNPRWEHTFTYRGLTLQELATRALELSLWDRDRLASNDFMGAVRLSLATGTYMGASVNWMDSVGKEITLWQNMMQQPNLWVEGSLPLRPQLIN